jgi:hypothetical protein
MLGQSNIVTYNVSLFLDNSVQKEIVNVFYFCFVDILKPFEIRVTV